MNELYELPPIRTISALKEEDRNRNVRENCKSVFKRLDDNVTPHDRKAILVCYGPSLKKTFSNIPLSKGDIFTVSGAHKFLINRGIIPYVHIDCDPRERKSRQFGEADERVRYWMASCVDPLYIEKLEGYDVTLWHLHNGPESEIIFDIEPDSWLLVGGGSVGLRAVSLLYSQGYRNIEIHGMDCSFDGDRFAGEHLAPKKKIITVSCGDRFFESDLSLIDYSRQFIDDLRLWPDMKIEMHGDGLLQHMLKTRQEN